MGVCLPRCSVHLQVANIIARRMERLHALQSQIDCLARSPRAVSTATTAPLLDTLNTEALMLEKVLEVDTSQGDQPLLLWLICTVVSAEHRQLRNEASRVTRRACHTVPRDACRTVSDAPRPRPRCLSTFASCARLVCSSRRSRRSSGGSRRSSSLQSRMDPSSALESCEE